MAGQFFATNNYRQDDSGFAAYETLGRRVGGQYDQAGNDIRDIGRAQAATINMLGRWPFNILDLEKRESLRFAQRNAPARGNTGSPGGVRTVGRGDSSSITDSQFGPRREISLSALNQISEGAGRFGAMVSGGSQLPELAARRAVANEQYRREQARQAAVQNAAYEKSWDAEQKQMEKDRQQVRDDAQKAYDSSTPGSNTSNPDSPYYNAANDFGGAGYVDNNDVTPSTADAGTSWLQGDKWYTPSGLWSGVTEGAQLLGSDTGAW